MKTSQRFGVGISGLNCSCLLLGNHRTLFNVRNLQELSDSVEDATTDANSTLREALETSGAKIAQIQTGIQRGLAKQRYLSHLSDQYNDGFIDEESKCCILCKCDFSKVHLVLFVCLCCALTLPSRGL